MTSSRSPRQPLWRHRFRAVPPVLVAAALLLAACSSNASNASSTSSSTSTSVASGPPVNVKLGVPIANAEIVPIWYGISTGIFRKYGLNVTVAALGGSTVVNAALASGSVDVALDNDVASMEGIEKGVKMINVAQYTAATPSELIANKTWAKANNLTKKSSVSTIVHALIGAKVGTSDAVITGHEDVLLKSEGVNPTQVHQELVSSESAEQNLLVSGQIDAFVAGPPLPNEMASQGQGVILIGEGTSSAWSNSGINLAVVAATTWAKSHAKVLSHLISAIHDSTSALLQHPARTVTVAEQNLQGSTKQALLDTYPLEGYSKCPTQTAASWKRAVQLGVLGGSLPAGSAAKQNVDWTNKYVDVQC